MLKPFKIIITIVLTILTANTFSAGGILKGKVQYIRTHAAGHINWEPPIFWFTLEGVTTGAAGECNSWNGNILFAGDTDQAYTMVLGAYMSGNEIAVRFDDTVRAKDNHWCRINFITIGNPAPLK